jgi:hypothetical protein
MSEYPPRLVQVSATAFGSLLALSDSRVIPINISPARLNQALVEYGRPALAEFLAGQSLGVFADTWETATADWDRISAAILTSALAAAAFGQVPAVWEVCGQSVSVVRDLPQRVYGGLGQALYTSHPFQFRPDPNRPAPWVRGLLSASGGRLFNTWVHLGSGQIEVDVDVLMGHFVE